MNLGLQNRSVIVAASSEGIARSAMGLDAHTGSGIRNCENQTLSTGDPIRAFSASHQETPAVRHGIYRIGHEIT